VWLRSATCAGSAVAGRYAWHTRCDEAGRDAAKAARLDSSTRHRRKHRACSVVRNNPKGEDVMQLVNAVKSFARNEEGQDLLEYALLVALIALVAITAVQAAGQSVFTIFNNIANALANAA
jgi:pilus assembly protein Flp/PilA